MAEKRAAEEQEDDDGSLDELFSEPAAASGPTTRAKPATAGTAGHGKGTVGTPSAITERFAQMDSERKAFEATMQERQQASDVALATQRTEFEASVGLIMGRFDDMTRASLEQQKKSDERFMEFQAASQKAMQKAEEATVARFEQFMTMLPALIATNTAAAAVPTSPVVNDGDHDSGDEPEAKQKRSETRSRSR
jgi:hypothetical protein